MRYLYDLIEFNMLLENSLNFSDVLQRYICTYCRATRLIWVNVQQIVQFE